MLIIIFAIRLYNIEKNTDHTIANNMFMVLYAFYILITFFLIDIISKNKYDLFGEVTIKLACIFGFVCLIGLHKMIIDLIKNYCNSSILVKTMIVCDNCINMLFLHFTLILLLLQIIFIVIIFMYYMCKYTKM
jgi:hypothetical protein